ncbi:MAG: hypothetical protein VX793_09950, partial [Pseudomonadota bacterium]|nr:hypothetical protein [Pseudomonadota bacterium]
MHSSTEKSLNERIEQRRQARTLPRFIAVEGPIGAGKTSLAKRLAMTFGYDLLLEQDGRALLLYPVANYYAGDDEAVREMIDQPSSLLGLA